MRCEQVQEVKALLGRGHWPEASGEELRAHVARCSECGDVVLLAEAFGGARAEAMMATPVISPGVIWWRAQVRRRQRALEQIARPVRGAQVFACVVALLLGLGLVVAEARRGLSWGDGAQALRPDTLLPAGGVSLEVVVVAVCVGVVAVLGGLLVYLGVERR